MPWNIAQAKQQFSEVVRLTAQEPQAIYNRDKPVALMVNPAEFAQFQEWRSRQREVTLIEQFNDGRAALAQAGLIEIPCIERGDIQRPNAFVQMLATQAASNLPPAP